MSNFKLLRLRIYFDRGSNSHAKMCYTVYLSVFVFVLYSLFTGFTFAITSVVAAPLVLLNPWKSFRTFHRLDMNMYVKKFGTRVQSF